MSFQRLSRLLFCQEIWECKSNNSQSSKLITLLIGWWWLSQKNRGTCFGSSKQVSQWDIVCVCELHWLSWDYTFAWQKPRTDRSECCAEAMHVLLFPNDERLWRTWLYWVMTNCSIGRWWGYDASTTILGEEAIVTSSQQGMMVVQSQEGKCKPWHLFRMRHGKYRPEVAIYNKTKDGKGSSI